MEHSFLIGVSLILRVGLGLLLALGILPLVAVNQTAAGVMLIAIETQGYAQITENQPGDPHFPASLLAGGQAGTDADPIPAIVSAEYLDSDDPQSMLGQTIKVTLTGTDTFSDVFLRVDKIRDRFRAFPDAAAFIVAPIASIQSAAPDANIYPTTLFVGGATANKEAIQTIADQQALDAARSGRADRSVEILSLAETHDRLTDAPLVRGVSQNLLLGSVVAGLYSVLAIVTTLNLSARSRKRDVGYLRTLGLSSRQTVGLTAVEYLPLIVVASVIGLAFGVGIARLVEPGINLGAFIGPEYVVALRVIWWEIGLIPAGLALATALAIAVFAFVAGRMQLGELTRIGDA